MQVLLQMRIQLRQRQGEAPADDAPEPGRGELLLAMRRLPTLTLPMAQLAVLLIARPPAAAQAWATGQATLGLSAM